MYTRHVTTVHAVSDENLSEMEGPKGPTSWGVPPRISRHFPLSGAVWALDSSPAGVYAVHMGCREIAAEMDRLAKDGERLGKAAFYASGERRALVDAMARTASDRWSKLNAAYQLARALED